MINKKIAYILDVFPGTPPFVFNEIKKLSELGFMIMLFSANNPKGKEINNEWMKNTYYVANYLALGVIFSHLFYFLNKSLLYINLLVNNKKYGGWQIFWKSVYYAHIIKGKGIKHIHAHFAWDAADCARIIKKLTGITFSLTVHARDLYVEADHFKGKLDEAERVITCVNFNKDLIIKKWGNEIRNKIRVIYHGANLDIFDPHKKQEVPAIDVLSVVQRFVEKKGIRYLIEAVSLLKKKGQEVKCQIIGEGGNIRELEKMIIERGVENNVKLVKPVGQEELVRFYSQSKLFVLPCVVAQDGDRDGIPNVLAEAMAMEMTVICSNLPNIAELVEDEKDGILVPERNTLALAEAIEGLLQNDEKRKILGRNARLKVMKIFDFSEKTGELGSIFERLILGTGVTR